MTCCHLTSDWTLENPPSGLLHGLLRDGLVLSSQSVPPHKYTSHVCMYVRMDGWIEKKKIRRCSLKTGKKKGKKEEETFPTKRQTRIIWVFLMIGLS